MAEKLIKRWGVALTTIVLTLASIGVASILVFLIAAFMGTSVSLQNLAAAILIPVLSVPFILIWTLPALRKLRTVEDTVQLLATTDPLTMAFNRKRFAELLEYEFSRAQRYDEKFSILLFDLDNFRAINETFGFKMGDQVLRTVSNICQAQMRRSDMLARLGNDEFACLLPHTLETGATEFAERLRATVADSTVTIGEQQVEFTISVGVKTVDKEASSDEVIRSGLKALDEAKKAGKNRIASAPSLQLQHT
ncbi:MAG: GGDEF domain-containing protein [Chloroflexi bacterium]|nr:GGDEF domain-containing protein [Chloroflexota bacterium]